MGQVNKVQVHRLILPDSVDEQMLVMLNRKQKEFDQFARESELANSSVTGKDISDESLAREVITKERERLGLSTEKSISFSDDGQENSD
jgi:hypothetical protein